MTQTEIAPMLLMHVKWFAPFDVHVMPKPVGEVLNGTFVKFFLALGRSDRSLFFRGPLRLSPRTFKRA